MGALFYLTVIFGLVGSWGCPGLQPKGDALPAKLTKGRESQVTPEQSFLFELKGYLVSFGNGEPAGYTLEKSLHLTKLSEQMAESGGPGLVGLEKSKLAVITLAGKPLSLLDLAEGESWGIDFTPEPKAVWPSPTWWVFNWQDSPLLVGLDQLPPRRSVAYLVGKEPLPGGQPKVAAGLLPFPDNRPSELILPAGERRLLFGYLDQRERGSYQLEVDPETGQVRGKDERRTLRDRLVVAEKEGPKEPLRKVGEVELTVLEPRTKPPEFAESPWFVDGDLLMQLRSSPDAPLGEPNFRLLYWRLGEGRPVQRGGIRLPMSTVECYALRGDPEGRYVVVICPPDPRLPLPEGKAETHLMLVDLLRGKVRFDDTLPLAEGRLGVSHLIRGRDWLLVGSWQAASAEQAGQGSFWYLDFAGRVPQIRRLNLTAGEVEIIPPSNLELAWVGHGAVVREVEKLSVVEDHTILTVGLGEQGKPQLLRLTIPEFEEVDRAPLPAGQVVLMRPKGEREVELVVLEKRPAP